MKRLNRSKLSKMSDLSIVVEGASFEPYAVLPTLDFDIRIIDRSGAPVHALVLRSQVRISPGLRQYTVGEKSALREIFGEPYRWEETLKSFFWCDCSLSLGSFEGSTKAKLHIPLSTDLDVSAAKYFNAIVGGEVPLEFLFSGTLFQVLNSRLMVQPISWSLETTYRLSSKIVKEALDSHFPGMAWIKLSPETLAQLTQLKNTRALATWDSVISYLLSSTKVATK